MVYPLSTSVKNSLPSACWLPVYFKMGARAMLLIGQYGYNWGLFLDPARAVNRSQDSLPGLIWAPWSGTFSARLAVSVPKLGNSAGHTGVWGWLGLSKAVPLGPFREGLLQPVCGLSLRVAIGCDFCFLSCASSVGEMIDRNCFTGLMNDTTGLKLTLHIVSQFLFPG